MISSSKNTVECVLALGVVMFGFNLPLDIGLDLRAGYGFWLFCACGTYFLSILILKGNYPFILFALHLFLFLAPLKAVLASGLSDQHIIGGLLPWVDAGIYYRDALGLFEGERLSDFSTRPLYPGFLASSLYFLNNNLIFVLVAFGVIHALTALLFYQVLRDSLGTVVAGISVLVVFLFYRRFIGSVMPTQLGLVFGEIAVICLVHGLSVRKRSMIIVGQFFLLVGLLVRPGALLIVPLIMAWGLLYADYFRWSKKVYLFYAVMACVGAIGGHALADMLFGALEKVPFSHYAMIFYGLVKGGQGYGIAISELNDLGHYEVYQAAWRSLISDPGLLFQGVVENYKEFASPNSGALGFEFVGNVDSNIRPQLIRLLLMGLSVVGVLVALSEARKPLGGLIVVGIAGFYLSIAGIPPASADEMRAFSVTMPFLAIACGVGGALILTCKRPINSIKGEIHADASSWEVQVARSMGLVFFLMSLFSPWHIRTKEPDASIDVRCPVGSEKVAWQIQVGSHIKLIDKDLGWESVGGVSIDRFRAQIDRGPIRKLYPKFSDDLQNLSSGTSLWIRLPYIVAIPTVKLLASTNPFRCIRKVPGSRIYSLVDIE